MTQHQLRAALLVSGGGTTMAAILAAIQDQKLVGVEPALIIASKPGIGAIEKALALGIDAADILVISPKDYPDQASFGAKIIAECRRRGVNFISQNGWLPHTPRIVIEEFPRIINQHPGPLDPKAPGFDFGGKGMYGRRVIAARLYFCQKVGRDRWTEAVSQFVHRDFDRGQVIRAKRLPILDDDTVESIQKRLLPLEHEMVIETIRDFASNAAMPTVDRSQYWLVNPEEKDMLEECKARAVADYPHG